MTEAAAHDYNLRITNADKDGHFMAGTELIITGKNGAEVVKASNAGPLFYAKVQAGAYTITATHNGNQQVRNVKVLAEKSADIYLRWQPQLNE